jgi:hypothetical protein
MRGIILGLVLVGAVRGAVPTVPAIQDWAGDSIRKGCRELGFPPPLAARIVGVVESGIEEGAVPCQRGSRRLEELARMPSGDDAVRLAASIFDDLREVLDIRDLRRGEAYGFLPPLNRVRALVHVEAQARKSRGSGPAGLEGGIAWLRKGRGANLRSVLGVDAARAQELMPRLEEFGAARKAVRLRRERLFGRLERAAKTVAAAPTIEGLVVEWQALEQETAALDRSQLARVERTLTLVEKIHAARELRPLIDRGMRWAAIYFKIRGTFNRREGRAPR